jgi:putative ABC transport system substrate-binding protein
MKRREFISLLGASIFCPARAQEKGQVRRVAVLAGGRETDSEYMPFQQELKELGWELGRNLEIDYAWAVVGERARIAPAEVLRLQPDVVLSVGTPATKEMQRLKTGVPVVFLTVSEPVTQGIVQSLAHPGGNITGFSNLEPTVGAKWLQLLKEIAPSIKRVTIVVNPQVFPLSVDFSRSAEAAAPKFAVEAVMAPVHDTADIEAIMTTLGGMSDAGLIFPVDPFTYLHRELIIELSARYQLPAIHGFRIIGTLISYGVDIADVERKAAGYVDRILRGEKPGDLPVQQPTKFELVIDLKVAKALGLDVPPNLLSLADFVIE